MNKMKNVVILLSVLFMMTACGGDSGGKATSTNLAGTSNGGIPISGGNGSVGGGSTQTPTAPGVTPYSRSVNTALRSELYLEFNMDASGQVAAFGDLDMSQQAGFGNCVLPMGSYDISTSSTGIQGSRVHNYRQITLSAIGPVSFTALLESSLSLQNQNGEWVMLAQLKVQSVGGSPCNVSLSFGMPLAQ